MAPSHPAAAASPVKRKRSHNEVVKSDAAPDELNKKQLLSAPAQKISSSKKKKEKSAARFSDGEEDSSTTEAKHLKEKSDRKLSKEEKKAEKAATKEAKKKERKERKRAESGTNMADAMDTSPNGDSIAANGTPTTSVDVNKIESHENSAPVTPIKHKLSKLTFDSPAPSPATTDTPGKKKKKSVKFDPDAAAEDGTSRQEIHKAILGRYASAAIVTAEDFASSLDADKPPPSKKVKREKKKKQSGKNSVSTNNEGTSREAAILYLVSYHTDKANWKFNKAKQNWILRHLFDVDMIPFTKENGAALKAYIAGLQSKDARERLIAQANAIIQEIEKFNEEKAKRDAEKAALDDGKDDDEDDEDEDMPEEDEEAIARGKKFARAKLVLASMGDAQAEREAEGLAFTKPQASGNEEEDSSDTSDESSDDDESD